MASVTSEEIAKWWPLFERTARRFDGLGGVEFDDLVQEQAEAAWLGLELGFWPTQELLDHACLAWVRFITHRGKATQEFPYVRWLVHEHLSNEEQWAFEPDTEETGF